MPLMKRVKLYSALYSNQAIILLMLSNPREALWSSLMLANLGSMRGRITNEL